MGDPASLILGTTAFTVAVVGWLLYFRERQRSRDYATDMRQLVYDYDLGRDDLRRSLRWPEVADPVKRWEDERGWDSPKEATDDE